jgi:hypothetical protein
MYKNSKRLVERIVAISEALEKGQEKFEDRGELALGEKMFEEAKTLCNSREELEKYSDMLTDVSELYRPFLQKDDKKREKCRETTVFATAILIAKLLIQKDLDLDELIGINHEMQEL